MFKAILPFAALALQVLVSPAAALDLEAMPVRGKRIYCVAYGIIDLQVRYENGTLDKATYDRDRIQFTWRIQNRGDNQNYASDFRRLDQAVAEIIAEQPSLEALSAQAAQCRSYLRM